MVTISAQASTLGAVSSNTIVSVISDVVFHAESLNLIYTVLVPSHADNVHAILELHVCRLVGLDELSNATCTHPTPASVAHVVFNVTDLVLVYAAVLLIEKLPDIGVVLSIVKL